MTGVQPSLYRGRHPADVPLYSAADAARYLRLPPGGPESLTFRELTERFLAADGAGRVEFDGDTPIRLYPFTRPGRAADAPRLVVIDPRFGFGNPVLAGSVVRTDVLAGRFRAGEGVAELADDTGLPVDEVEEAIRYEAGG